MKELLEARDDDERAAVAVDAFCYRIRLQIGAYAAALGGPRHARVHGRDR